MKQRIADAFQVVGCVAFTAAGFTISNTVGLVAAALSLVTVGVVMERS